MYVSGYISYTIVQIPITNLLVTEKEILRNLFFPLVYFILNLNVENIENVTKDQGCFECGY